MGGGSRQKNAFQWDAYRPLVDRIPACTVQEGSAQGVSASGPGGCIPACNGADIPPVDKQTLVKT